MYILLLFTYRGKSYPVCMWLQRNKINKKKKIAVSIVLEYAHGCDGFYLHCQDTMSHYSRIDHFCT